MPETKNFEFRIKCLDQVFCSKQKGYNKDALLEKLNDKLDNEGFKPISIRQLGYDLEEMKIQAGKQNVDLEYDRGERRYKYSDPEFSLTGIPIKKEDIDLLTQALAILNHIQGLKRTNEIQNIIEKLADKLGLKFTNLGDIILFDQVLDMKGIDHLNILLNKIIEKQPIKIFYKPFQKNSEAHIVHPYFLKEYNNRWYLFGLNESYNKIFNYPLDRIVSVDDEPIYFNEVKRINPWEYFKNIVGVTRAEGMPKSIKLKFIKPRAYYVETKPIHSSQKKIIETEEYIIFMIKVIPNKELDALILSFGMDCEVMVN